MSDPRVSKTGIKPGDWVRVLNNDLGAPSPHQEGHQLRIYDAVKAVGIQDRQMATGNTTEVVVYQVGSCPCYIPAENVELMEGCVCAGPVIRNLGCRCGHAQMILAQAEPKPPRKRKRKGMSPWVPPGTSAREVFPQMTTSSEVWGHTMRTPSEISASKAAWSARHVLSSEGYLSSRTVDEIRAAKAAGPAEEDNEIVWDPITDPESQEKSLVPRDLILGEDAIPGDQLLGDISSRWIPVSQLDA